ncbi:hypothetical protein DFQ28_001039, partial [Apophysomyces sp. BC1034]
MALLKPLSSKHIQALGADTAVTKLAQDFSSVAANDAIPLQVRNYAKNCSAFVKRNGKFKTDLIACLQMRRANLSEIDMFASNSVNTAARVTNAALKNVERATITELEALVFEQLAATMMPPRWQAKEPPRALHIPNVSGEVQPFECAMSPIPQQMNLGTFFDDHYNSDNDDDNDNTNGLDKNETSFLSDDHHTTRQFTYTFENVEPWPTGIVNPWVIGSTDVTETLKAIHAESIKGGSVGDLSDLRILTLHFIFCFSVDKSFSCTRWLTTPQHQAIMNDLYPLLTTCIPKFTPEIATWAMDLASMKNMSFLDKKKACTNILNNALTMDDDTNFLAATVMFDWFPRLPPFLSTDPSCTIEDTFIHTHLDALLSNIFATDPIFKQEWSNGALESSRGVVDLIKPDWVVFVRPWFTRFDLGVCEVKPEGKHNSGAISDTVKLGIEMQAMINALIAEGLDDPRVCGILVKGYIMETYVMDCCHLPVYRHLLLDSVTLPSSAASFALFPSVFRSLLQVKNIAAKTGYDLDTLQASKAKGKRKLPAHSWIHDGKPNV